MELIQNTNEYKKWIDELKSEIQKSQIKAAISVNQQGVSSIRPLRMSEIADRLSMHTSTVSRAIAGKHVQTERGLFRLREFFDGGRIDAAPAAGQGRMALAQQIQDLVAAEDKQQPLSDDDLVEALKSHGVQAARRTVTKYRKELGIPSSYQRRRFGGEP